MIGLTACFASLKKCCPTLPKAFINAPVMTLQKGILMASEETLEVPVKGMDCAECVEHVHHAIAALPGVQSVDVYLSSEKAVLRLDPARVSLNDIRQAVADAGYSVPETTETDTVSTANVGFTRSVLSLFGVVFGAVLLIVIAGEGLG
ncbi:MAG: heavy-metal-associated domain-containing protein, partial [Anaerolinea sp.]|nr:heavy-metal-associated domain-containing protein [Anaerolinea sp.]